MRVTERPDLKSLAACTREINRLSAILSTKPPSVSPVQRLMRTWDVRDVLLLRARLRRELAEQAEGARTARLLAGARADEAAAVTLEHQYERLKRKARP